MNKTFIAIIIVVIILVLGGIVFSQMHTPSDATTDTTAATN